MKKQAETPMCEGAHETNILLIDAPSGAGKSQYIRAHGATSANTLTSEALTEVLLQIVREEMTLEKAAEKLCHITYFENMESLRGKEETQRFTAQLIQVMAKDRPVVLVGINFRVSLPYLLKELGTYQHHIF